MKSFVKNSIVSTRFFIRDNKITLLFITLFTIGTALGSIALCLSSHSNALKQTIEQYYEENASLSVILLFSRNVMNQLFYLLLMYLAGLCALGLPAVGAVPLLKGIALGALISYKYIFYGIKGLLYTAVILWIPHALILAVFTFAYSEGIYMSLTVSNGIFNGKPRQVKYTLSFLTFTKRYVIFATACILIALVESVLSALFSKLIT